MAHHARAVSANRLFALAAVLLTLVFVLMVSRIFDTPARTAVRDEAVVATPAYEAARTATTLDTDADGMPDWEETLLGSDPKNADENSNGVKDGEEQEELFARLDQRTGTHSNASSTSEQLQANSLTEMVAKNLMGSVMESFKNKERLGEGDIQDILSHSVDAMSDITTLPQYTKSDVHVVPTSQETRIAYLESVRVNLLDALNKKPNEYNALNLLVQEEKEQGVRYLMEAIAIYETAALALRNVAVPEEAVETHALLVSGLLEYAESLKKITQFEQDPILATIGLNSFGVGQGKFATAMTVYMQYTKKLNEVAEESRNTSTN
ncbi:MAG: hypothetical protein KBD21_03375 [Candidatus Pacebacteria bacterium]|nr:hypothetical protein [Candidatus Paceibacterota bacterium]